jgi:hypothetical protein
MKLLSTSAADPGMSMALRSVALTTGIAFSHHKSGGEAARGCGELQTVNIASTNRCSDHLTFKLPEGFLMIDISSVRLFAGLGKDEVHAILAAAVKRRFKESEMIIRAEQPSTRLIIVKTGCVDFYIATEKGQQILLRRFGPGNAFGIATFLSEPMGYLGTASAVQDVEVLTWEHRSVLQLARDYPPISSKRLSACIALYCDIRATACQPCVGYGSGTAGIYLDRCRLQNRTSAYGWGEDQHQKRRSGLPCRREFFHRQQVAEKMGTRRSRRQKPR